MRIKEIVLLASSSYKARTMGGNIRYVKEAEKFGLPLPNYLQELVKNSFLRFRKNGIVVCSVSNIKFYELARMPREEAIDEGVVSF